MRPEKAVARMGVEERMSKVQLERKAYRKSPGRQYGYEYDPLRSRNGQSRSGVEERISRSGALLAQRPDPRRTRQLMRQSIIASKTRANEEETEPLEEYAEDERRAHTSQHARYTEPSTEEWAPERLSNRAGQEPSRGARSRYLVEPRLPSTRELMRADEDEDEFVNLAPMPGAADPGYGAEDDTEDYADDGYDVPPHALPLPPVARSRGLPPRTFEPSEHLSARLPERSVRPRVDDEDDYEDEYSSHDDDLPPGLHRVKKKSVSRRGLLLGLGAIAVGGAAYELAPKVPGAVSTVGANIEHQVQDAFNRGLAQGADNARKELLTALDNLEGVTLEGAVQAAAFTRTAYDVFVSPIITFGATLTGDVLSGMLKAFKTAREWLAGVYQDNATLIAIQKVLESWVDQANKLPKHLDAVTQTDIDGAQAYLRGLQQKINDEKAKLNNPQQSSTPGANTKPTAASKPTAAPKTTQ